MIIHDYYYYQNHHLFVYLFVCLCGCSAGLFIWAASQRRRKRDERAVSIKLAPDRVLVRPTNQLNASHNSKAKVKNRSNCHFSCRNGSRASFSFSKSNSHSDSKPKPQPKSQSQSKSIPLGRILNTLDLVDSTRNRNYYPGRSLRNQHVKLALSHPRRRARRSLRSCSFANIRSELRNKTNTIIIIAH